MFGRKNHPVHMLQILDARGNIVFYDRLDRLSLTEDCLINLSIEFFDDPAPCEIHRSAVMLRVIAEIEASLLLNQKMSISGLDRRVQQYFDKYAEARDVCIQ